MCVEADEEIYTSNYGVTTTAIKVHAHTHACTRARALKTLLRTHIRKRMDHVRTHTRKRMDARTHARSRPPARTHAH